MFRCTSLYTAATPQIAPLFLARNGAICGKARLLAGGRMLNPQPQSHWKREEASKASRTRQAPQDNP